MEKQEKIERLYYIDWLRIIAVMLLFPFHTGMIFVTWDFHIKNDISSTPIIIANAFIDNWHMPLFFLLSGTSTWLALRKRTIFYYVKERFFRLFIPLIFGMLVVVPPQTFFERIQKSGFQGSYFNFYTQLFNGIYPEGNLTWNHLWFLFYLFFISLFALPLLIYSKSEKGRLLVGKVNAWFAKGYNIFLLSIPLAVINMSLKVTFPGPQNIMSDWARIVFMLLIFYYGILFSQFPDYKNSFERNFGIAFVLGVVCFGIFTILHFIGYEFIWGYNIPNIFRLGVTSFSTWCWLIVFLGLSVRYLNFSNSFLKYASEAVLPVYILHQTVIIALGFYIVKLNSHVFIKYGIINIFSFAITLALYDVMVKRIGVLRFLFGMRKNNLGVAK